MNPIQLPEKVKVLASRELLIKSQFLGNHTDVPAHLAVSLFQGLAQNADFPFFRIQQTRQDGKKCRFACSIRTKQAKYLPASTLKAHPIQGLKRTKTLAYVHNFQNRSRHG